VLAANKNCSMARSAMSPNGSKDCSRDADEVLTRFQRQTALPFIPAERPEKLYFGGNSRLTPGSVMETPFRLHSLASAATPLIHLTRRLIQKETSP
jgi:hypothetical protein